MHRWAKAQPTQANELTSHVKSMMVRRERLQRQVAAVLQIGLQPLVTAYLSMTVENEHTSSQSTNTQNLRIESTSRAGLERFGLTPTPPPPSADPEESTVCAGPDADGANDEGNNTFGKGPTG